MPEGRPLRIGVTGAAGLLGRHLRAYFHGVPGVEFSGAQRATFASEESLAAFVEGLDAVVHLAGMNRGDDAELEAVNLRLAEQLIAACEGGGHKPHVLFASSTHITRDTAYARSKRKAAASFESWARRSGGRYTTLVLPQVFGEGGRPFYNSVVATFCHQLAAGEKPKIIQDAELELLHAQRVAELALEAIRAGTQGELRPAGAPLKVSALLETLEEMDEQYRGQVVPDLREPLRLDLFNTLRAFLYPDFYPVGLTLHTDPRGGLFEAVKSHNGGQSFLSTTKPGVTRGNHYHRRKVERFLVIKGQASIRIRPLFSKETREFLVDGDRPQFVDMPTLHPHSITNTGAGELLTLFWSHEIFSKESPDTFAEPV